MPMFLRFSGNKSIAQPADAVDPMESVTKRQLDAINVPASTTRLGLVKVGPGMTVDADGTIYPTAGGGSGGSASGVISFTDTYPTVTAGQLLFTTTYTVGNVDVFINGVMIINGTDFFATNGSSITLASDIVLTTTDTVCIRKWGLNSSGSPAGAVEYFAMNTAPTGYIKANGAAVSRAAYATLFAAIGTTFGTGDGSTTFNLPDLRGVFPRGFDDGRGYDAGRAFGSYQADEFKSHNHALTDISQAIDTGPGRYGVGGSGNGATLSTSSTGGLETRPKNIALLACIKY